RGRARHSPPQHGAQAGTKDPAQDAGRGRHGPAIKARSAGPRGRPARGVRLGSSAWLNAPLREKIVYIAPVAAGGLTPREADKYPGFRAHRLGALADGPAP